jgi:putative oxidoreductase
MTQRLDVRLNTYSPAVLSLFRIVFGLLFTLHGTQKLFDWPIPSPVPVAVGSWPFWWAGVIELVTGLLITVGLFTRIAALIASGHMAVAFFWKNLPNGVWPIQNGGELAVLFCFGFLLLATTGGGLYAVDARRRGTVAANTRGARGRFGGWRRGNRSYNRR